MKTPLPPAAIRSAAVQLLAPYFAGLDESALIHALRRPAPGAAAVPAEPPALQGLRPTAAARTLGVSCRTLRTYVRRGLLHPVHMSRRCVLFDARELSRVLAGGKG